MRLSFLGYFCLWFYFFDLLLGEQAAEDDSWYIVCISNLVKVFEFKYFIFRFVSTLGDKCILHISHGIWGLERLFPDHLKLTSMLRKMFYLPYRYAQASWAYYHCNS